MSSTREIADALAKTAVAMSLPTEKTSPKNGATGTEALRLVQLLEEHPVWQMKEWNPGVNRPDKDARDNHRVNIILASLTYADRSSTLAHWNALRDAIDEITTDRIFGSKDRCTVCGKPGSDVIVVNWDSVELWMHRSGGCCNFLGNSWREVGLKPENITRDMAIRVIIHARGLFQKGAAKTPTALPTTGANSTIREVPPTNPYLAQRCIEDSTAFKKWLSEQTDRANRELDRPILRPKYSDRPFVTCDVTGPVLDPRDK